MKNNERFLEIMDRVDKWVETNRGWYDRLTAIAEVNFWFDDTIKNKTDDEIVESACSALMAEE
jgi:hypothetical protein